MFLESKSASSFASSLFLVKQIDDNLSRSKPLNTGVLEANQHIDMNIIPQFILCFSFLHLYVKKILSFLEIVESYPTSVPYFSKKLFLSSPSQIAGEPRFEKETTSEYLCDSQATLSRLITQVALLELHLLYMVLMPN